MDKSAASSRGSMKVGPSEDYLALLRGEITPEAYVRRLKTDVDGRAEIHTISPRQHTWGAGGGDVMRDADVERAARWGFKPGMSIYGWIWFAIFGLALPIAGATTIFYGEPWPVLLFLVLVPMMYALARRIFWSPFGL